MKNTTGKRLFAAVCAAALVFSVLFIFVFLRQIVPETQEHNFPVVISYERGGEPVSEAAVYCCAYQSGGEWIGWFEHSGTDDALYVEETDGSVWVVSLALDPAYLMGDSDAEQDAGGSLPEPFITLFDGETGEETTGLSSLDAYSVRLSGCTLPEPIENRYIDAGPQVDQTACLVLTGVSLAVLACGLLLIRKDASRVSCGLDRVSRIFNFIIAFPGIPLMTLLCLEWESLPEGSPIMTAVRLIPAITVLGLCASILLRRSGKSRASLAVQFAGPALFLLHAVLLVFPGMMPHSLTLPAGVVIGVLIALHPRKAQASRTKLDRASLMINILLIPVYLLMSVVMVFFAALVRPSGDPGAALRAVVSLTSFIIACAPVYCASALGLSVSLRRRGRSGEGFAAQFLGFAGIALAALVLGLTDLLPFVSASIN